MGSENPEQRSSPGTRRVTGRILHSPVWQFAILFSLAFAIRAALLAAWVDNHENFYRLTGEMGRVAAALMRTGNFADPYMIPTGPTAHPAPLWPSLLALIYSTFGVTTTAGYVRSLVAISSYSALAALLPWLGLRLGLGARAGMIAGVAAALVPQQSLDESIGFGVAAHASIAFGLVTAAFLRRWTRENTTARSSLLLGVGCGAAFHVLPPLLLVVVGFLLFELWWRRGRRKWLLTAFVAAGAILVCIPWTWRNATALRGFFFIRSNFGLELRIANRSGADADIEVTYARAGTLRHPSENLAEARLVRDLGEAEYMRRARIEATDWIASHPAEFLRLTGKRFLHFWCGPLRYPWLAALFTTLTVLALLGLRRIMPGLNAPGQAALAIPLVAFPLVYYVVSYVAHYPAPLSWLLYLLAGYEVQSWFKSSD